MYNDLMSVDSLIPSRNIKIGIMPMRQLWQCEVTELCLGRKNLKNWVLSAEQIHFPPQLFFFFNCWNTVSHNSPFEWPSTVNSWSPRGACCSKWPGQPIFLRIQEREPGLFIFATLPKLVEVCKHHKICYDVYSICLLLLRTIMKVGAESTS